MQALIQQYLLDATLIFLFVIYAASLRNINK